MGGIRLSAGVVTSVLALALPAAALGHSERPAYYPDHTQGSVPQYRTDGPAQVVCKPDSQQRIEQDVQGAARDRSLALLADCAYEHIQAAVNAAASGDRILVLPGVYREEPSRTEPEPDPACDDLYTENEGNRVPSYEYQRQCPNAQNLIAITGDGPDDDRACDSKCDIQIEGTGDDRGDVLLSGARSKLNVIRADRADGVYLKNFTIEFSDFNNIYVLETNGFRIDDVESRWSREYGVLSFASDNGLYENIEAYGSGDSGVYPGSGPEGHCQRYGIEIRNVDSHGNTIGYSGTAGNGIWAHDNRFHDNATGLTTDSFAAGHPGMPQDCAKWESNQIYSNNLDLFSAERDEYCKQPIEERDPQTVCPTFQVPVGSGAVIAGGNGNIIRGNWIYDNWRQGTSLFWVPAALRGEDSTGQSDNDPTDQYDTSHDNAYTDNHMGVRPDGTRDPNGVDFWWDEEGRGNCWSGNSGPGGAEPTSDPLILPRCGGPLTGLFRPGNPVKQASQATCATWTPSDNTDPPGCSWFDRPPEPQ